VTYIHYTREYEDRERSKFKRRVAFIAHMLLPGYFSTTIIQWMLALMGTSLEEFFSRPFFIKWLSFPVMPPVGSGGEPVWVDFYLIPALATDFMPKVRDGTAYQWCEAVALHAIAEAERDGVELWIGWGAGTKNATGHGQLFLERNSHLVNSDSVYTTHGDGGTVSLAVAALGQAAVPNGLCGAIIGANGAIGDALARFVPQQFQPRKWVLVGRPDKPGENDRRVRLDVLRQQVEIWLAMCGHQVSVLVHQDKSTACLEHNTKIVVVATTAGDMELLPDEVQPGALVVDLTTPSACSPSHDWSGRTVITAGCGQFTNPAVLPCGFGEIGGRQVTNVGAAVFEAGGNMVIWGCTAETIVNAMFSHREHIAGPTVDVMVDVPRVIQGFRTLKIQPQPPVSCGHVLRWEDLRGPGATPRTYTSFLLVNSVHAPAA